MRTPLKTWLRIYVHGNYGGVDRPQSRKLRPDGSKTALVRLLYRYWMRRIRLGGSGGMLPQKIFWKFVALRWLLRSFFNFRPKNITWKSVLAICVFLAYKQKVSNIIKTLSGHYRVCQICFACPGREKLTCKRNGTIKIIQGSEFKFQKVCRKSRAAQVAPAALLSTAMA